MSITLSGMAFNAVEAATTELEPPKAAGSMRAAPVLRSKTPPSTCWSTR